MDDKTKRKINKVTLTVTGSILLLIIIIVIATSGGEKKEKQPEPFMNLKHAWTIARELVKERLKSPSTADFPWEPVGYKMESDSVILLQGFVDSQNSFGAEIRTKFIIKLKYYGGDWADSRRWQQLDFVVLE